MSLQLSDATVSRKAKQISNALVQANNFLASTGLGDALIGYAKGLLTPSSKPASTNNRKKRSRSSKNSFNPSGQAVNKFLINNTRPVRSKMFQAPTNLGYQLPPAHMSHVGIADRLADRSTIGSLKLKGGCLLDITAVFYSANPTYFGHGVASAGSGAPDLGYVALDILEMDPRVENTAKCYAFWKFRKLSIHYVPLVGTNTSGSITTALFDDYYAVTQYFSSPFCPTSNSGQQAALTSQWSNTSPVWCPHTTSYVDGGAKLFPSVYDSGSSAIDDTYQCALVVVASNFQPINGTNPSASTGYNLGQFFMEYEIDFYDPVWSLNLTLESGPALSREARKALRNQAIKRKFGSLSSIPECSELSTDIRDVSMSRMETPVMVSPYAPSASSLSSSFVLSRR